MFKKELSPAKNKSPSPVKKNSFGQKSPYNDTSSPGAFSITVSPVKNDHINIDLSAYQKGTDDEEQKKKVNPSNNEIQN